MENLKLLQDNFTKHSHSIIHTVVCVPIKSQLRSRLALERKTSHLRYGKQARGKTPVPTGMASTLQQCDALTDISVMSWHVLCETDVRVQVYVMVTCVATLLQ